MAITNYVMKNVLDSTFGRTSPPSPPSNLYIALSTTKPLPDGTGFTEPSGGNYARVSITNNLSNIDPATVNDDDIAIKALPGPIQFPVATDDWGTITHWGVFDAENGGNLLDYGRLSDPLEVVANDQVIIPDGEIEIWLLTPDQFQG